ncbi:MAG TPA: hypothetical protein VIK84_01505 [Haloplasmataceae bacterium]
MKKRPIYLFALTFLISLIALIGTTYAWFSETITVSDNIIKTGILDVTFEAADNLEFTEGYVNLEEKNSKLLDLQNVYPGETYTRYVKVTNTGTIELCYRFTVLGLSSDSYFSQNIKYHITMFGETHSFLLEENIVKSTDYFSLSPGKTNTFKIEIQILDTMDNQGQDQMFRFWIGLYAKQLLDAQDDEIYIWPERE